MNMEIKHDWLEQVWMEVQAEIDAEEWAKRHESDPDWLGTSMYPVDAS